MVLYTYPVGLLSLSPADNPLCLEDLHGFAFPKTYVVQHCLTAMLSPLLDIGLLCKDSGFAFSFPSLV